MARLPWEWRRSSGSTTPAARGDIPFARNALSRSGPAGRLDGPRAAFIVDRDIGEIAVGNEDRLHFLAPKHPGFEMHGDRGPADPHQIGVDRNQIADEHGFAEIHRLDRDRDRARL